jgi:hypothetical protein
MIVYFMKKSKSLMIGGVVLLSCFYVMYIFGQIHLKNRETIQIISAINQTNTSPVSFKEGLGQGKQNTGAPTDYLFVASSRGKYYYPKNCSRAKSLSVKNMLYFKDKLSAEQAGYLAYLGC